MALQAGTAVAATFTPACTGTTGDPASLVTAITQANAIAGPDTVALGSGCTYALTTIDNYWYGPNGLPPIASDITIEGNGATIARKASAPFRLFFVAADPENPNTLNYVSPGAGKLTLRDLTLSGGFARGGDSDGGGGGAAMGGAIFSQGVVAIEDSTLSGNLAEGGFADDSFSGTGGGGMGESSPHESTIGGGFGPGTFGGGIGGAGKEDDGGGGGAGFAVGDNGGAADSHPEAAGGAGGGPVTGTGGVGGDAEGAAGPGGDGGGGGGASFGHPSSETGGGFGQGGQGNGAGGAGGGVGGGGGAGSQSGGGGGFGGGGGYGAQGGGAGGFGGGGGGAGGGVLRPGAAGFGGGTAVGAEGGGGAGMGGAVFNMQGTLRIDDSTLADNSAIGGSDAVTDHGKGIGGAVFNLNGAFTTTGSTFAANTAAYYAAQIYNLVYDGHTARTAQTTLRDTIVAGGVGPADLASVKTAHISPPPLGSANADLSQFDLVRQLAAPGVDEMGTVTGSPLSADPLLGPLQDNGGATQTMAPASGSPVIDAGSAFGLTTDQRGMQRPCDFASLANAGDGSDIGAVELQTNPCAPPTHPHSPGPQGLNAFGAETLVTLKLQAKRITPGSLPVVVSNGNAFAVSGELSGQTASRFGGKRKKRITLKAVPLSLAKGVTETVKLKLPGKLVQTFKRNGKLPLTLSAVVYDPAGNGRAVKAPVYPKLK